MSRLHTYYVNEIFNGIKKSNLKVLSNDDSQILVDFSVDEYKYTFSAEHIDYEGLWDVAFFIKNDAESSSSALTGNKTTKQTIEVFNNVLACFELLIQTRNPKTIECTASKKEPSRIKFYKRLFESNKTKNMLKVTDLKIVDLPNDIKFVMKRWE